MEEEKTQSKEKSSGRDKATPNPTQESNTKEQQQGGGGSGGEKKKSKKEKSSAKSSDPKKQQSDSNANNKEVKKESKEKTSAKPTKQQESKKEKELELEKTQKGESSTPVTGKAADTPVQSPTTPAAAPSPNPSTPKPPPAVAATVSTAATSLASLENDPDTKFFGRKVHIKHLTAGIGAFQIFTIIVFLALHIYHIVTSSGEKYYGHYVLISQGFTIVLHGIMFIALVILLIGVCTKSQSSLLPYISWSFIAIFIYAGCAVFSIFLVIVTAESYRFRNRYRRSMESDNDYYMGRSSSRDDYNHRYIQMSGSDGYHKEMTEQIYAMMIWSCVFMVLFVFSLFLQIWYTVVACYCYKYFLKLAILQHQILKSNFNNAPGIAVTAAVNVPLPQQQQVQPKSVQQPNVPATAATPLQQQQPQAQPNVPQQQQQPPVVASTPVNFAPPTPQLQPSTPQPSPLPPQQQQPVAAK